MPALRAVLVIPAAHPVPSLKVELGSAEISECVIQRNLSGVYVLGRSNAHRTHSTAGYVQQAIIAQASLPNVVLRGATKILENQLYGVHVLASGGVGVEGDQVECSGNGAGAGVGDTAALGDTIGQNWKTEGGAVHGLGDNFSDLN